MSTKARGRRGHVPVIAPRAGSGVSTRRQGCRSSERTGCLPRANAFHASARPAAVAAPVATASHVARSGGAQWGSIWGLPVLDP